MSRIIFFQQFMSTDSRLLFEEKENVLCYHGPLMYEAKV